MIGISSYQVCARSFIQLNAEPLTNYKFALLKNSSHKKRILKFFLSNKREAVYVLEAKVLWRKESMKSTIYDS